MHCSHTQVGSVKIIDCCWRLELSVAVMHEGRLVVSVVPEPDLETKEKQLAAFYGKVFRDVLLFFLIAPNSPHANNKRSHLLSIPRGKSHSLAIYVAKIN